jgi:hypothetical protein
MRLLPILLAAVFVGGAAASPTVVAPRAVSAVALDEGRSVFATVRECGGVRVWRPVGGSVIRIGKPRACPQTSTGAALASVAVAGNRVLWLEYVGGNLREWSLFTGTTTRPQARRLHVVTNEAGDDAPIVLGGGDGTRLGGLLPYAVGRAVFVLRVSGGRRFSWAAPALVTALDADRGQVAVATLGGLVTILDANGDFVRRERFSGRVSTLRITRNGVAVQYGRTVEVRGAGPSQSTLLPRGGQLVGAAADRVYYASAAGVRVRFLADGRDTLVAAGTLADVDGNIMVVAAGRRLRALRAT